MLAVTVGIRKLKITLSAIVVLLMCSLYVNFRSLMKICKDEDRLELAREYALEVCQIQDTTDASPAMRDFLDSFAHPVDSIL